MKSRPSIKITFTSEQIQLIQQDTRLKVTAQELTAEALEERIAPAVNLNSSKSNAF